jgi:tetratricopeptide (TPR) repeat protein
MTPCDDDTAACDYRRGAFRRMTEVSLLAAAFLIFALAGCSFFRGTEPSVESQRNSARFHHAVKTVRTDLGNNNLEDAYRIVRAWEGVPLPGEDEALLERLSRQVRSSYALNLAGQATQLERLGRLHEAQDAIRNAREAEPGWSSLKKTEQHLKIRIAVQSSMDEDWEGVVRRLMVLKSTLPPNRELDRTLSWAWGKLATSQYAGGRLRQAMESATQSLANDPDNGQAKEIRETISKRLDGWIGEGEALFRKNDLTGALSAFRRALAVDPANPKALKDESLVQEALAATRSGTRLPKAGGSQPTQPAQH